ncbi:UDP-glucose 4-epimerase GalE [Neobacillus sp. Marseille-QA0830]
MILVTGGAGYIGSHVTRDLLDKGYQVLVLDNLSTGHKEAVDKRAIFVLGNCGDEEILDRIFQKFKVEAVMHFSANCLVEESVQNPLKYYSNNVEQTICLLRKMNQYGVRAFIFSSTCATYGIPSTAILTESHPQIPINPYGRSKLMMETVLKDISANHNLNYVILRYFNVGGAHTSGQIGEDHDPETHLIPNVIKHLQGVTDVIKVFGNDYPTSDGTSVRDYIHVSDLSNAHILAYEYLCRDGGKSEIFNLGNGTGYSVLEIIKACETIANREATIQFEPRRSGDPPLLIASFEKIKQYLGWVPKHDLSEIIQSSWNWHEKHPDGY